MNVTVVANTYQGSPLSIVLVFKKPLFVNQDENKITVNINAFEAQELHELLGKELICTDCSCYEYGCEQGREKIT